MKHAFQQQMLKAFQRNRRKAIHRESWISYVYTHLSELSKIWWFLWLDDKFIKKVNSCACNASAQLCVRLYTSIHVGEKYVGRLGNEHTKKSIMFVSIQLNSFRTMISFLTLITHTTNSVFQNEISFTFRLLPVRMEKHREKSDRANETAKIKLNQIQKRALITLKSFSLSCSSFFRVFLLEFHFAIDALLQRRKKFSWWVRTGKFTIRWFALGLRQPDQQRKIEIKIFAIDYDFVRMLYMCKLVKYTAVYIFGIAKPQSAWK